MAQWEVCLIKTQAIDCKLFFNGRPDLNSHFVPNYFKVTENAFLSYIWISVRGLGRTTRLGATRRTKVLGLAEDMEE